MLKIQNAVKKYQSENGEEVIALRINELAFPSRGLFFIVGESGSGKTTLLNLLSGIDYPTSGKVLYCGKDVSGFTAEEKSAYLAKEVALVFQDFNLLDDFTVEENLSLASALSNQHAAMDALREVGLEGYEGRKCFTLSGGEKQRVAIARSVCRNARVLLCDEPTGSLDAENGRSVMKILRDLAKKRLVIVVSHDLRAAYEYGDRVIRLSGGIIVDDEERASSAVEAKLQNGALIVRKGGSVDERTILGFLDDESLRTISFFNPRDGFKKTVTVSSNNGADPDFRIEEAHPLGFAKSSAIGRSMLRSKRGKFGFCLVLNLFALTIAFSCAGIACFDKPRQIADSVYAQSWNYLSFDCGEWRNGRFDSSPFTKAHEETMSRLLRQKTIPVIRNHLPLMSLGQGAGGDSLFLRHIPGIAEYDASFFDEAGLFIAVGRAPKEAGEILIGDYILDSYRHFGSESGAASISDLLGDQIVAGYKVSGVFSSAKTSWFEGDVDLADYPTRPRRNSPSLIRKQYNSRGLKAIGFVASLDPIGQNDVVLASYGPSDRDSLLAAVRFAYSKSAGIGFAFHHSESAAIEGMVGWLDESKAFWIVLAALFYGISFLLSSLFLSSFNRAKRMEFVTLLSMGAKERDLRSVLLEESFFAIGIPSVTALPLCLIGFMTAGDALAKSASLGAAISLFGWIPFAIAILLSSLLIVAFVLLSSLSMARKPLAVGLREGRREL